VCTHGVVDPLSGSLGSFECFFRNACGSLAATLAGPMVLLPTLFLWVSSLTEDLNLDTCLGKERNSTSAHNRRVSLSQSHQERKNSKLSCSHTTMLGSPRTCIPLHLRVPWLLHARLVRRGNKVVDALFPLLKVGHFGCYLLLLWIPIGISPSGQENGRPQTETAAAVGSECGRYWHCREGRG